MIVDSTPKISSHQPHARSLPGDALAVDAGGGPVLVGGVCRSCGVRLFPFAEICPACIGEDIQRDPMPREGTLYSFTVVHVGPKTWDKPYMLGYVDLDNGVRVFSHLRGSVRIGQRVALATSEIGTDAEGTPISTFVFQPVGT
jgi:uncharacterized OB-fold protein